MLFVVPVEIGISYMIQTKRKKERKRRSNRFKKTNGYDKSDRSNKNPVVDGNISRCLM